MTASKFFAASLIALTTLGAGTAMAAGNASFSGEHPFDGDFAGETTAVSLRSRAEVQAEGVKFAGQMATGENSLQAQAPASSGLTRAEVRAQGRAAMANDQIALGELSQVAAATQAAPVLSRAQVLAEVRNGALPAAGNFN